MARVVSGDGVSLSVEESGRGHPILFIHEFAGNQHSWMRQVNHFSRGFRCITFSARGYPPSDVPTDLANYSQDRAVSDAIDVLDALSVEQAHVVGLSMGGFCALHLGLRHPHRVTALVVASVGYGAHPDRQAAFREECEDMASTILADGLPDFAQQYAVGPARIPLRIKNPLGWAEFVSVLAGNSGVGMAMTMRGVQKARPSLYDLTAELRHLTVPTLLLVGNQDPESIEPSAMLQQTLPSATLSLLPAAGHTLNLEDPDVFNALVEEFLTVVERPAGS